MLNSIQQHVKGLLDGLALPGQLILTSYVRPPVFEGLTGPRCYVWGGAANETRQSAPRGQGFKRVRWTIDTWLVYEELSADGDETVFPGIVDAVMAVLRSAPMPVPLTDPITSIQTQLVEIGEQMTLDYPPLHTAGSLTSLLWAARVSCQATEAAQG